MIDRILSLNEKEEEKEDDESDNKSNDESDDKSGDKPDDKPDDKSGDKPNDKPDELDDKPEEKVPVANQKNHGINEVEEVDEYGRIIHHQVSNEIAVNVVTTYNDTTQQSKAVLLSLDGLLDYNENDTKEKIFEVSLLAETFKDMLLYRFSQCIYDAFLTAIENDKEMEVENENLKPVHVNVDTIVFVACCYFDEKNKGFLTFEELMDILINGNQVKSKSEAENILNRILDNKKFHYAKLLNDK